MEQANEIPGRTPAQHNTEWLYYQIIADVSGHTAYEIYENMASRLLRVIDEDGDVGYIKPSSLNTLEHNSYLERVKAVAAEFNIWLPEPEKDPGKRYDIKKFKRQIK